MKWLLFAFYLSFMNQLPGGVHGHPIMKGQYLPKGSAPPEDKLFRCIYELNDKPYSAELVENCLKSISKNSFVQQAWVRRYNSEEGARIFVEFFVMSRLLTVGEISFAAEFKDENEETNLREWLNKNPAALRVGGYYTRDGESTTWEGIRQFYRSRGVLVAATATEILDYNAGKARLIFQITYAPKIPSRAAFPPYGNRCNDPMTYVNETQIDKHVPISYLEAKLGLSSNFGCFTTEAAQHDLDVLKSLPILENVDVSYKGKPGSREVYYKIKGKPLAIRHLTIQSYGTHASCVESEKEKLNLRPGDIYLRSAAEATRQELQEKLCPQPGNWTEVTEQDFPVDDKQVDVVFNVLAAPMPSLIINGIKIE